MTEDFENFILMLVQSPEKPSVYPAPPPKKKTNIGASSYY